MKAQKEYNYSNYMKKKIRFPILNLYLNLIVQKLCSNILTSQSSKTGNGLLAKQDMKDEKQRVKMKDKDYELRKLRIRLSLRFLRNLLFSPRPMLPLQKLEKLHFPGAMINIHIIQWKNILFKIRHIAFVQTSLLQTLKT